MQLETLKLNIDEDSNGYVRGIPKIDTEHLSFNNHLTLCALVGSVRKGEKSAGLELQK